MAEVSTIARPYAKAAFEFAKEAGELPQWSDSLALASAVAANPDMKNLLDSPALGEKQKAAIFIDACGAELANGVKNFVAVLAEHKRLAVLSAISQAFEVLKAQQEHAVDVEVISAYELSDDQQANLTEKLKAKWEREISISSQVDKSLIGGVIIRAGDLVIDDSIRGRLTKLSEVVSG